MPKTAAQSVVVATSAKAAETYISVTKVYSDFLGSCPYMGLALLRWVGFFLGLGLDRATVFTGGT